MKFSDNAKITKSKFSLHIHFKVVFELSGKVEYERERLNTVLKCGALQIKLPAFPPTSKVVFFNSTLHSSVGRQLVRTTGLNCALIKNVQNKIFGAFGLKILSK